MPVHIEELRNTIFNVSFQNIFQLSKLIIKCFKNIAWYLDEKVVDFIINGVHKAVKTKQSQYTVNTKIPVYKTELYCMVTMVDLIVTPRLRRLDMEKLPRILRTHITARLQV